jgi:dGTPase
MLNTIDSAAQRPYQYRALAPYAVHPDQSRGRRYAEPNSISRTPFERDRDRVIHCVAFRRLEYKTQVFVNHENDLFRTRLTHTLEVAQIARSIARNLNLNEDLVEAIALSHDLGHTPFGHAGQEALNICMRDYGGFEHNLQSLRIVEELEHRYASFDGLNLTYETREGILKHCSRKHAQQLGELGQRFLKGGQPSLEAQLVNLADEITYINHDVDDGLRSQLLDLEQLESVELWTKCREIVTQRYPELRGRRFIHETIRTMINHLIIDLIQTTQQHIIQANPDSVDAVRHQHQALIRLSDTMAAHATQLKQFLFNALYRHHTVMRMNSKAKHVINRLFDAFMEDPRLLPPEYQSDSLPGQAREIANYIAGMTDRYAIKEYQRLFNVNEI